MTKHDYILAKLILMIEQAAATKERLGGNLFGEEHEKLLLIIQNCPEFVHVGWRIEHEGKPYCNVICIGNGEWETHDGEE